MNGERTVYVFVYSSAWPFYRRTMQFVLLIDLDPVAQLVEQRTFNP